MQETIDNFKKAYTESVSRGKQVYLHFDTNADNIIIPQSLKSTGDQVLNISKSAIRKIDFGTKYLEFLASFEGKVTAISLPYDALICFIEGDNDEGLDI